jgi:hypothetical protein
MDTYQQLRDAKYDAIADVYTHSDPRFQTWVRENMQNKDHMAQMNNILATNAHTKRRDESNADYTKQYIEHGLFNQIVFKGGSHRKRSQRKRSHKSHRNTRRRMGGIHQMFQYNKKSKNGGIAKSSVGKLRRSQKGGHDYTVTSSSTKRGIHLLEFLKEYDDKSQIIGPNFVNCSVHYKGIVEKDAQFVRNYLRVNYADSAEIIETGPTSRGEYMFRIISYNEDSKACMVDLNVLSSMADNSYNKSSGTDRTYSYVVKTDATDALRYYLTRNSLFNDLHGNGLTKLDAKPPK